MLPARVLLIDDDPFLTRRARTIFDDDVDLQVVTNGIDALAAAEAWQPDVVVLDLLLADEDSFALLDALGGRGRAASPRVICLSKGAGSATRFRTDGGQFLGVLRRDSGAEGLRAAVIAALCATSCMGPSAA